MTKQWTGDGAWWCLLQLNWPTLYDALIYDFVLTNIDWQSPMARLGPEVEGLFYHGLQPIEKTKKMPTLQNTGEKKIEASGWKLLTICKKMRLHDSTHPRRRRETLGHRLRGFAQSWTSGATRLPQPFSKNFEETILTVLKLVETSTMHCLVAKNNHLQGV